MEEEYTVFVTLLLWCVSSIAGIEEESFTILQECPGKVMQSSHTYHTQMTASLTRCARLCMVEGCRSYQYEHSTRTCSLHSDRGTCHTMVDSTSARYFEKAWQNFTSSRLKHVQKWSPVKQTLLCTFKTSYDRFIDVERTRGEMNTASNVITNNACLHGGSPKDDSTCACVNGYVGTFCERPMTDCSEGWLSPHGYTTGTYYIKPLSSTSPILVYCEMKSGGRTRMLYRKTNMDFYRTWQEYRDGFGDVTGDHWLGLQHMHEVNTGGEFDMKIEFKMLDNSFYQQYYKKFIVTNEGDKYRMTFESTSGKSGWPLGDCLGPLNGSMFSTHDSDNDNSPLNCAQEFNSGWWFNACAECNPTGQMLLPTDGLRTGAQTEVFWTNNMGNNVPIRVHMWLVRP